jgi:DNA-binding PadR family transcriptional regulator
MTMAHLILGLLRDGFPRHGYDLIVEYKRKSGAEVSAGNFYRELARLAANGLLRQTTNPPEADSRRIPYAITELGKMEFDRWLQEPSTVEDGFEIWLLFLERVPPEARDRLIDRRKARLWLRGTQLSHARQDALTRAQGDAYDALAESLTLRLKRLNADVEFLAELRARLDETAPSPHAARAPRRAR